VRRVAFHPDAKAELDYAAMYYESQRPGLGGELLIEVERTLEHVAEFPESGVEFRRTGYRRFVVRRFPYLVVYGVLPDMVRVVVVAHGKQRPGYWRSRRFEKNTYEDDAS
jgi:toxin ParE1/3/4